MPENFQKQLKYYTPQIYEASFVMPYFAKKMVASI